MCWSASSRTGAASMAEVILHGFDDLQEGFRAIGSIPFQVTKQALDEMAKQAENSIRQTGEAMGVRDENNDSGEHILDHISHSKPMKTEDGGKSFITFKGTRLRGNTVTWNAAIAYINEYGAPKRGITARPFITTGMARNEQTIAAPAEQVIGDWIERTYGK